MEEAGWKKDEKPYLIFTCSKCKQYLYVKTSQKTKKCLRCGKKHKVSSIIISGEIVEGMTEAVEMVKRRQNELAIKELGHTPELRAEGDFSVIRKRNFYGNNSETGLSHVDDIDNILESKFDEMLNEVSESYDEFPFYVLEMMVENYNIPLDELKMLVKKALLKGDIICIDGGLYKIENLK